MKRRIGLISAIGEDQDVVQVRLRDRLQVLQERLGPGDHASEVDGVGEGNGIAEGGATEVIGVIPVRNRLSEEEDLRVRSGGRSNF